MTTIQVSQTTKQMLEILKEQHHATSYDMVIQQLLGKHISQKPMFGAFKKLKKWSKEDRAKTKDEICNR